jgi:hypothetical protein
MRHGPSRLLDGGALAAAGRAILSAWLALEGRGRGLQRSPRAGSHPMALRRQLHRQAGGVGPRRIEDDPEQPRDRDAPGGSRLLLADRKRPSRRRGPVLSPGRVALAALRPPDRPAPPSLPLPDAREGRGCLRFRDPEHRARHRRQPDDPRRMEDRVGTPPPPAPRASRGGLRLSLGVEPGRRARSRAWPKPAWRTSPPGILERRLLDGERDDGGPLPSAPTEMSVFPLAPGTRSGGPRPSSRRRSRSGRRPARRVPGAAR